MYENVINLFLGNIVVGLWYSQKTGEDSKVTATVFSHLRV